MPPEVCPNCGAVIPLKAKACPGCGSDEMTGWSDSARADNLGIPQEDFNYENFVKEEFGSRRLKPRGLHWVWWLTALVLVALFLIFCLRCATILFDTRGRVLPKVCCHQETADCRR